MTGEKDIGVVIEVVDAAGAVEMVDELVVEVVIGVVGGGVVEVEMVDVVVIKVVDEVGVVA